MAVVLAMFGAAVAWLIAAVTFLASGANPVFGYVAFGLAGAFTIAAAVAYWWARKHDPARQIQEAFDKLKGPPEEDELEDVPDPWAGLKRTLDLASGRKRPKRPK